MSIFKNSRLSHIPIAFKYLLVIGVIFVISLLFPNNARFKYNFSLNSNWKYEDLIAPFDFAIQKTEAELELESRQIEDQFSPYYKIDYNIAKEQVHQFEELFAAQIDLVEGNDQFTDVKRKKEVYLNFGKKYLEDLFNIGVIKLNPIHLAEGDDFVINIIEGNRTYVKTLEGINDVDGAIQQLKDDLPESNLSEPEFLLPVIERSIIPNLLYEAGVSDKALQKLLASIPKARDIVKKGDLIVNRNAPISEDTYQKLLSFRQQYQNEIGKNRSFWGVYFGYLILTILIMGAFLIYLLVYSNTVFQKFNNLIFVLMWIVLYSYLVYLVEQTNVVNSYIIPFAIVPIVIKTFFEDYLAIFMHIIIVLIASFLSAQGYEFTFMQILVGVVVLLSDIDTRNWSKFFYAILYVFLTYVLGYIGLSLIKEGDLSGLQPPMFFALFLNVFLTLLAFPLIPLLERFFGFTSAVSLLELSDMNRSLLRDLSLKAPGTLQHSLQVANLAESAAQKIGADPLLVKVGALYHDIGKMENPEYFIENQSGNNLHDALDDKESAQIIIGHVQKGVDIAKKKRVPNLIIDFIRTHHGTTRTEYFYRNYKKNNPEVEVDEAEFRYPGPKPKSKEETILMLADSIEAACKSLKNPTDKELYDLIDKIIKGKIEQEQFSDSMLSFKELGACQDVFFKIMKSVHHVRIVYPEEKKKSENT